MSLFAVALVAGALGAEPCLPPGGLEVPDTARRTAPNGTQEVTEFFGGGAYRVTFCDAAGGFRSSTEVVAWTDPSGARVRVPVMRAVESSTTFGTLGDPDDPRYAAQWRAERSQALADVPPPTPGRITRDPAFASPAPACRQSKWSASGRLRAGTHGWFWNGADFGHNRTTLSRLTRGHTTWDNTVNDCGLRDFAYTIGHRFLGHHRASVHTYQDGIPTIDKGRMGSIGCSGFIACTRQFTQGGFITNSDIRFSNRVKWTNTRASGAYDYWNVTAHEVGHSLGLNHVGSTQLTMYHSVALRETKKRTLGRGDVLAHYARYR